MSFTTIDHVIDLIENLLLKCWPIENEKVNIVTPFCRLDYETAMEKYGTDKPDLRSEIEIKKLFNEKDGQNYFVLVIPQEYVNFKKLINC